MMETISASATSVAGAPGGNIAVAVSGTVYTQISDVHCAGHGRRADRRDAGDRS
jgi:hypothetical protein